MTVSATAAIAYARKPHQKAMEIPKKSAMTIPNTEAQTDVAPLMPQRNAVGAPGRDAAARMPIANGMPMRNPTGAISIFEKLESLQKKKPGLMAKVFSTHPLDADRIRKAQAEIDRILPARSEYVVTTSEYGAMRVKGGALPHPELPRF